MGFPKKCDPILYVRPGVHQKALDEIQRLNIHVEALVGTITELSKPAPKRDCSIVEPVAPVPPERGVNVSDGKAGGDIAFVESDADIQRLHDDTCPSCLATGRIHHIAPYGTPATKFFCGHCGNTFYTDPMRFIKLVRHVVNSALREGKSKHDGKAGGDQKRCIHEKYMCTSLGSSHDTPCNPDEGCFCHQGDEQ